jgi:two-component system response regulator DevR
MPLNIFVVDDHVMVRRAVCDVLGMEGDIDVVGEAGSVADARALVPASGADVAVLDVRLPDGTGIELSRELRSSDPALVCLMLTSLHRDQALLAAVIAGAAGFVVKQVSGFDIVGAVRGVAGGESLISPETRAGVLDQFRRAAVSSSPHPFMNEDEDRVFELLAEGRTDPQIAVEMMMPETAVSGYVARLMTLLGLTRAV